MLCLVTHKSCDFISPLLLGGHLIADQGRIFLLDVQTSKSTVTWDDYYFFHILPIFYFFPRLKYPFLTTLQQCISELALLSFGWGGGRVLSISSTSEKKTNKNQNHPQAFQKFLLLLLTFLISDITRLDNKRLT